MRRRDREIHDPDEMEHILQNGRICRLGLCENNVPYIVPMNYGYAEGTLYFHSAKSGRKLTIIKQNSYACFEIEVGTEIIDNTQACNWGMRFKSVIGYGTLEEVQGSSEKAAGLAVLMKHYSGKTGWELPASKVEATLVLKLRIDTMSGKQSG